VQLRARGVGWGAVQRLSAAALVQQDWEHVHACAWCCCSAAAAAAATAAHLEGADDPDGRADVAPELQLDLRLDLGLAQNLQRGMQQAHASAAAYWH
jgi:hypothetical protein